MAIRDGNGLTPLHVLTEHMGCSHFAAWHTPVKGLFEFLIDEGCDVSSQCPEGNTPLHLLMGGPSSSYQLPFSVLEMEPLINDRSISLRSSVGKPPLDCLVENWWMRPDVMTKYMNTPMMKGAIFGPEQKPLTYVVDAMASLPPDPSKSTTTTIGIPFLLRMLEIVPDAQVIIHGPVGVRLGP